MAPLRGDGRDLAEKSPAGAGRVGVVIHGRVSAVIGRAREIGEALVGIAPTGIEDGQRHRRGITPEKPRTRNERCASGRAVRVTCRHLRGLEQATDPAADLADGARQSR